MRAAAQETAPHIGLRLIQRGSGERAIYKILVKRGFNAIKCLLYKRFSASHEDLTSSWKDLVFFEVWRDAKIVIMKSVSENIYLKTCSTRFPGAECLTPPELPQAMLKVNSCGSTGFNLCRGWWQMPLLFRSWQHAWQCHFVVDRQVPLCSCKMTFPDVW